MKPQIGDKVLIRHRSEFYFNKLGNINSSGNIVPGAHAETKITALYRSGRVKVTSGDVWVIKPFQDYFTTVQ